MKKKKNKKIQEEMKRLVLARLRATSGDLKISIGSGDYSKEDLLKKVEKEDEIGMEIVEIQMEYLRDMAQGKIYEDK